MGINTHVYTIYGVRLDWNENFFKAYEEIQEGLSDEFGYGDTRPVDRQIEVIMDYMCGDYMILGNILYNSGDFRYHTDMNSYQEINADNLESIEIEYKKNFKRLYPDHFYLMAHKDFQLINFIHYS